MQERPIYLNSDFGKLEKEKVYVRRGSSTAIETRDEVARIGRSSFEKSTPNLCLNWADLEDRTILLSPCHLEARFLEPRLPNDTFEVYRPYDSDYIIGSYSNRNYSIELIDYAIWVNFLRELGFRLRNESETVARRVRFVCRVRNQSNVIV